MGVGSLEVRCEPLLGLGTSNPGAGSPWWLFALIIIAAGDLEGELVVKVMEEKNGGRQDFTQNFNQCQRPHISNRSAAFV